MTRKRSQSAFSRSRSAAASDRVMPDFEVYIDDDRYSVPSLYLITASSQVRARAMAEELLAGSDHHRGVELRQDGEPLYALGSFSVRRAADSEAQGASPA
jgi:hypothetical protein